MQPVQGNLRYPRQRKTGVRVSPDTDVIGSRPLCQEKFMARFGILMIITMMMIMMIAVMIILLILV